MKRLLFFTVLFSIMSFSNVAHAQFWKNVFHKKKSTYHKVERQTKSDNVLPKPGPYKKKITLDYPPSAKKTTYRIDVLVPLYINELEKSDKKFPERALPGIEFYQGIKLATDTLNSFRYNMQVYVHDVNASGTEALISSHKLDSSDLIIGALNHKDIAPVAQFAKRKRVNFVSALSPLDAGIKENPYFILPQPTLQTHCKYIIGYVQKKHPHKKMVLCYRTVGSADESAYNYIMENDEPAAFSKLLCNTMPRREQLAILLDSTHTNLIVMPILDHAIADSLLRQLYNWFPGYDFEVYGMPSWKSMPGLKKADAYPNVTVFFTASFYIDQSSQASQNLEKQFRKAYGGKPAELVYRAYETLYWYAYLLNEYGTIFDDKFSDKSACLYTKYDIVPRFDKDQNFLYHENQHVYLYKYQSSSYIVEQ